MLNGDEVMNETVADVCSPGLSEIRIDDQVAEDWTIFPIELKKEFIET